MTYTATLSGTPFHLRPSNDRDAADLVREIIQEEGDGYSIDLDEEPDGRFTIGMLDTQEVGDAFHERVARIAERLGPLVIGAFELTLRNCDTASDDRDSAIFGGSSPQAVRRLQQDRAVTEAISLLHGAGVGTEVLQQVHGALMQEHKDYEVLVRAPETGATEVTIECRAEDEEHAIELAMARYPRGQVQSVRMTAPDSNGLVERALSMGLEINEDPDQDGKFYWYQINTGESSDVSYDSPELAAQAALDAHGPDQVEFHLNLQVKYQLNGEPAEALAQRLERAAQFAIGDGLLTGSTAAEVNEFTVKVEEVPTYRESEVRTFIEDRIEDGAWEPNESLLLELALKSPAANLRDFDKEMRDIGFGRYREVDDEDHSDDPSDGH
ncbi:hypothetical protein KBW71_00790 [Hydrogenophaga aromaticivorans]|uniref:hypothetical protein n=1 Tax=Hydrogenophaga aromaticivorans TaxID=2610898 RepID=UPI001B36BA44|nr:hypothetical protein [Hydrogenophaga aromaticivorans]MBQ0916988.1 hypothetical protein [Hydrogenophaga aromaticivorans]